MGMAPKSEEEAAAMSRQVINRWTPLHLLSGVVMQKRGFSAGQAMAASVAFELAENTVVKSSGYRAPQDANNMAMDTVFNMLGYMLGKKL
jgi:hypothetical protein